MIFLVGSIWFWLLILVTVILLVVFDRTENGFGVASTVLLSFACLQWAGDADILGYIERHHWLTLMFVSAYMAGGIWWTWHGRPTTILKPGWFHWILWKPMHALLWPVNMLNSVKLYKKT